MMVLPYETRQHRQIPDAVTVWQLAISISKRLDMEITNTGRLLKRIKRGLPTVYMSANYTLWADRFYLAAAPFGSEEVNYLYVTRKHISEEMKSDRACCRRRSRMALDQSIRAQFRSAICRMEGSRKSYAVRRLTPVSVQHSTGSTRLLDSEAPWL